MMKKLKVVTVVGTRPEIIRLSRVIVELDKTCEHILVHTGQNYDYELNEIFFEDLAIRKPDYYLNASGQTAAETIGNVIIKFDHLIASLDADAVLVLGDTNSCLSILPAKRRKIPTFHMEAGNRCFDMRVPEEINRRIVDHIADINLTYSSIARQYLLSEGLPPDRVIKVGSPMLEVLNHYEKNYKHSKILKTLELQPSEYFTASIHREENIDSDTNLKKICKIFNSVCDVYEYPFVVSTHPRTKKRIESLRLKFHSNVRLIKPLGFHDYIHLQMKSRAVLSDSGTINEESSILDFPALNLRETHERPEAMEEAVTIMTGLNLERVKQSLEVLETQRRDRKYRRGIVSDYDVPNVSEKVVKIILSYRDFVLRDVWKQF
jgi:UDP-N-acetylglucosamine 2-epimerase